MSIQKIEISNFTVFKDIKIDFSKGVNVLIGENGTGKTHLLKMLNDVNLDGQITLLLDFRIISDGNENCVFIPVKDMLTHAKGLIPMSKKYKEFPFDKTLTDIIEKAQQWSLLEVPQIAKHILPILERMMDGVVSYENDEFNILKSDGKLINFEYEAEGLKKIGLLWKLLRNESITEGSILLWDEPEANINPKFIPDLVEILLELSRNGVQIFLSTHNYILAKYFEVKSKEKDEVLFHSLYKTDDGVKCESKNNFKDLKNNTIMDVFGNLLDEVYEKGLGE